MLFNALYEFHALTKAPTIATRLRSDWHWVRSAFTETDLTSCGRQAQANWASDDAGWDCLYFLQAHSITGDETALAYAQGAVRFAYDRWRDGALGGGLWYNDDRTSKSLYETALALAALDLYTLTDSRWFLNAAIGSEAWIRTHLRRPDGLYWCTATAAGPDGQERPQDIHAGASVTYLGGNMGISVLQVRLARILDRPELQQAAEETAQAVARRLVDVDGALLDDRDAWNDGYFAAAWAKEVLSPKGPEADSLRRTAAAIAARDRTMDGFYGPDWDGENPDSRWSRGSTRPQQIMTSASAATIIVAAASLP
jgi:uncharacterized protein YyaL (SSP411 family)